MPADDVAAIAAGLSEAQRKAALVMTEEWQQLWPTAHELEDLRSVGLPLFQSSYAGNGHATRYRLIPLGQRVRQHLLDQDKRA